MMKMSSCVWTGFGAYCNQSGTCFPYGHYCGYCLGRFRLWDVSVSIADIFILILFWTEILYSESKHFLSVIFVEHEEQSGVLAVQDQLADHQMWIIWDHLPILVH